MDHQIKSGSTCEADCAEYRIGELVAFGDFVFTIVCCTDGVFEVKLSKCLNEKIQSVDLPEYVSPNCRLVSIGHSAFSQHIYLKSVTMSDSIVSIGNGAFYGCTSLVSIHLSSGLASIESHAFLGCISLKFITIPSNVATISIDAFARCTSLRSISVDKHNRHYYSDEYGVLFNKKKTKLIKCPRMIKGAYSIPSSVTSIGDSAFSQCIDLISVDIPSSVTSIGENAFVWCESLESVTIPEHVTSIGNGAFFGCISLSSVIIPADVKNIDDYVLSRCKSLFEIVVNPDNEYYSSESNVLFNKNKTELIQCSCLKKGVYFVPESVKVIKSYAFYGCFELKAIVIPSSVSEIEGIPCEFLNRCLNLEQIVVSSDNAVYSADDYGVLFDKNKTTLLYCPDGLCGDYKIPDTVKTVLGGGFNDCHAIKSITVPFSVSYVNGNKCLFFKEDGKTVVERDNLGGFKYVFNGEKFIRDSAIVKYTVDGVEHTDYIKLKKE